MGRTRNPEIQRRNEVIYLEWLRGASLTSLGERYSLARQVVGRIVAAQHPEEAENEDRALYRGELWRLYDEMVEVFREPGWKLAPTGMPARGPDGEPAEDVNAKIQAGELRLKVLGELRKMDGRDRPQQKQLTVAHEIATSQAALDIAQKRAEMEALARRAGQPPVVTGEVLPREIERGQESA